MLVRIGCEFDYESPEKTPSLWQVRPRPDGDHRIVTQNWDTPAPTRTYVDAYGNSCDRLSLPRGRSLVRYDATVEVSPKRDDVDIAAAGTAIDDLPDEVMLYLLPSRFCWPDLLHDAAWELFGSVESGWPCVQAICDWVHREIR